MSFSNTKEIQSVKVYDAQGRIIQKQIGINSQNTQVSIHSSNQGVYYFKVITYKGVLLKKVIKIKHKTLSVCIAERVF
ncbi:T9SS type A sorting domain-containing protein [Chryseobacterium sp. W4I1]|uniref:T9SS type A sorting domain-containing protein n=1 Tax=Chryseobacterium sp. W4I1 TaxID=3042293 RepID=UPI00359426C6